MCIRDSIDTGRFHYWTGDEDEPLSDGWWFWQQVVACGYSLPGAGRFDHDLRWGVPAAARITTPVSYTHLDVYKRQEYK